MARRYKDPMLQNLYDTAYAKGANDFMRRRGGSLQSAFMDGYKIADGLQPCRAYTTTGSFTYVAMMAGKDRRRDEMAGKIAPAEVINKRLLTVR